MCGIAGIVALRDGAPRPAREALVRMAGSLAHRGPDEFGLYRDDLAGLAHARLSIIDVASGQQPLANEDESLWVVFNGEIFNYVELRRELIELGHSFRTRSDTEVIVHAYEQWGQDAFARFNGQFALALWDARTKTLVLARDPLGIHPLHYAEHRGRLYFASEVKALFAADPSLPRALDAVGIDQTFTFWSAVPPRTVFQGVHEVEPGHLRVYRGGQVHDRVYWRPRYPEAKDGHFPGSLDEAVDEVRRSLEEATRLRMLRSDVPVGCYLSGGLDSSLVAALGLRVKGEKFITFSLRFDDAEYDETSYQREMARHIGSDHREVLVSRKDIAEAFPDVVLHAERPLLRSAPAPLMLLSKLARQSGVKVVLTGEGADEMFAGYDLFREAKVRRFWARQPRSEARPRLLERLYPYLARSPVSRPAMARQFFGRDLHRAHEPGFGHGPRWSSTASLKRLLSRTLRSSVEGRDAEAELLSSLPPEFPRWDPLCQDQYLEVRGLLAGYLLSSQGDRMLMANSVEGRFPFLDPHVVALANALPPSYKLRVLDEKHVLKRAARDLLPSSILDRKKQPYRAPDGVVFAGPDAPAWVADVLSERSLADAGLFDPSAVSMLWRKCQAKAHEGQLSNTDNMAVLGVVSAQLLHERLVRPTPEPRAVSLTRLIERNAGEQA